VIVIKIDFTEVGCQGGRCMEQALLVAIVGPKYVDDFIVNSNEIQQPIVSRTLHQSDLAKLKN
jgi:hypothetical protein